MKKRVLVLDCYLDQVGGACNIVPLLRGRAHEVVRSPYERLPTSTESYSAVVINGSRASVVVDPPAWEAPLRAFLASAAEKELPTLGICFGHQILAKALFGATAVRRAPKAEVGWVEIDVVGDDPILRGLDRPFTTYVSHADEVLPVEGLTVVARSEQCPVQVYRVGKRPLWGVQFHSEMPPLEAEESVHWRVKHHPELNLDAAAMLAARADSAPIAQRLFDNFFSAAGW